MPPFNMHTRLRCRRYFNTFGGNPVVCAAGIAVMETIEGQQLQQHAAEVGTYLLSALRALASEFPLIGDVRGEGLFVGVDFVRNRETREPASAEVSVICSQLKDEHQILTSIDGPHDNVLVIKPPMVFGRTDVDELTGALKNILGSLGEIDPASASKTPT